MLSFSFCSANALLEELQCLVEDAYATTLTANLSATQVSDYSVADNKMNHEYHFIEVEASVLVTSPFRHC
jgi:hypothetical protein